jgi:dTMP kinase
MDDRRYVAFEGVEGAGKSSVSKLVAEHLRGIGEHVITVREPGGTPVGEAIREILLGGELHPLPASEAALFAAARAQLVASTVVPALEEGAWVLSDRSAYSSLAYQGGGRGLAMEAVRELNDIALRSVWPDRVVLLRVDYTRGLRRQSVGDRIGDESETFHQTVASTFDVLAAAEPDRFVVVDAAQPLDVVVKSAVEALDLPR